MSERPVQIMALRSLEIDALRRNGMYWCSDEELPCDADPAYRVSEVPRSGDTTLNILAHLCQAHATRYAQAHGLTLARED